jgi:transposase
VIRKGTRHVINRAATSLRLAATTLLRSQSYLGAQYRRLRARLGAPKAITAMAHKLARLVYRMLKWGHEYVDKGLKYYEQRHREQQVQLLKNERSSWGCRSSNPTLLDLLREGFWRG